MFLNHILNNVGNTPMVQLEIVEHENINVYAKLEFYNPTGSVKDRAASYIINHFLATGKISPYTINHFLGTGKINHETTIIESSSGNFGVALSAYCRINGLKFICVVDPHIAPVNEMLMRSFGAEVIKVSESDEHGGFLLNRIKKVKELFKEVDNSYWVNQYGNPFNANAYYLSLGKEICDELEHIDYVFLGVSSGGTITGVSKRIKERFPYAKVIGVDIIGSIIFGHPPQKRYIPGIGSSMVPDILKEAKIDEIVMIDEVSSIKMCHELMTQHCIFAGGSSGSVLAAIKKYFRENRINRNINVVTIFADRGERYTNTIYNKEWCANFFQKGGGTRDPKYHAIG